MNYLKKQSGFTIVELLIVIVVIAILATISIIAYNGIQERSRATAVTNDIKALDKAFHLLAISEGRSTWWIDTEFTGGGNPTIDDIVTHSDLKNYFQKLSQPTIDATSSISYDNEGDTGNACSASATGGVNIYFYTISQSITQAVDDAIDDGNLSCGKVVHTNGGSLRYTLSLKQAL